MPSSVVTATVLPQKPVERRLAVQAHKDQQEQAPVAHAHEDFFWTYTEEPHRTRRNAIIQAHPEVRAIE